MDERVKAIRFLLEHHIPASKSSGMWTETASRPPFAFGILSAALAMRVSLHDPNRPFAITHFVHKPHSVGKKPLCTERWII
jgi:hypothetical protein